MALIEINRDNLFYNLRWFSNRVGSKSKLAVVLKDNAYGHGIDIIAKLSSRFGVKIAVVRDAQEAMKIKEYFKDIIVLGDRAIRDNQISFVLNSIDDIKKAQKGSRVELKVDTGMGRNGVLREDINISLNLIKQRELNLIGILSHNRSADELSSELFWQKKRFDEVRNIINSKNIKNIRFHSFNTASSIRLNPKDEDLIRVGIGIYGYSEIDNIFNPPKLRPVLSLYTNKISTKKIKSGSRVGYGGDFIAQRDMTISTYDIGYGDGLFRGDSKSPLIVDRNLPVLGKVSMDYITLETTKSRVSIFKDVKTVAKHYNTISYEILTRLSPSIKRVIT